MSPRPLTQSSTGSSLHRPRFEAIQLTASTSPADTGDKAAPRHLDREEKDLYDRGQSLRSAVQGNREGAEGAARQDEISIARQIRAASPIAQPNRLIVSLADKLLGREGRMVRALDEMGPGSMMAEGRPFRIDLD